MAAPGGQLAFIAHGNDGVLAAIGALLSLEAPNPVMFREAADKIFTETGGPAMGN